MKVEISTCFASRRFGKNSNLYATVLIPKAYVLYIIILLIIKRIIPLLKSNSSSYLNIVQANFRGNQVNCQLINIYFYDSIRRRFK